MTAEGAGHLTTNIPGDSPCQHCWKRKIGTDNELERIKNVSLIQIFHFISTQR
jgi:hypothetical protein